MTDGDSMTKQKTAALPDLDDDAGFALKLCPLQSVLPKAGRAGNRKSVSVDNQGLPPEYPEHQAVGAERIEAIETARGPN